MNIPTLGDEKDRHKSHFHAVQPVQSLGFVVNPPSLRLAAHKAKAVADWHTSMFLQVALARFINDGEFARHIRKMRGVYRARHDMVTEILKRKFANHLEVVPWIAGLHVAALARTASDEEISAIAQKASAAGVEVQQLSTFTFAASARPGIVLDTALFLGEHQRRTAPAPALLRFLAKLLLQDFSRWLHDPPSQTNHRRRTVRTNATPLFAEGAEQRCSRYPADLAPNRVRPCRTNLIAMERHVDSFPRCCAHSDSGSRGPINGRLRRLAEKIAPGSAALFPSGHVSRW